VTLAQATRAGAGALWSGSIRTTPVKYCSGPRWDGTDPERLSSIVLLLQSIKIENDPSTLAAFGEFPVGCRVRGRRSSKSAR
jgi:hypothetical protein